MGVKFSLEVIDDLRKSKMIDPTVYIQQDTILFFSQQMVGQGGFVQN